MRYLYLLFCFLLVFVLCLPFNAFGFTETKSYILITQEDISKLGAGTIQDVLNIVPGVNAGETSISIRGISKVRVVLDGKTINDPTSSHGGVKWEHVSLASVESVKVYRNSGSASFGSDASGGVIVITSKEKNDTSGFVKTYYGSYNTFYTYLSCQSRIDKLSLSAATGIDRTFGFRPNSKKKKIMIHGDAAFVVDTETKFSFSAGKISEKRGSPGLDAYPTPLASYEYDLFSTLLTVELPGFTNKLSYTDATKKNTNPAKNLDKELRIEKIRDELLKTVSWDLPVNLAIGSGYEMEKFESTGFSDGKEHNIWVNTILSKQFDSITIGKAPLEISLGARLEKYSEFGSYFSPELNLGIQNKVWKVRLGCSQTHNMPSFYQRYYESTSVKANPFLAPEQADNISLGFSHRPCSRISYDISLFYNQITDRITFLRKGPVGSYVNLGRVIYKGVDVSVDALLLKHLKLKTTYTYLDAKDKETGLFLSSKSRHKARANLVYNPDNPFSFRLSVKYASKVYANKANTKKLDAYTLGNFRIEYKQKFFNMENPLTIFAEVKNITDEFFLYPDGYSAAPRTWIAGFKARF